MQSRWQSIVEVISNSTIGFIGSWIITYLTFVYVSDTGLAATLTVVFCTIWSLVRGYFIRRYFAAKVR